MISKTFASIVAVATLGVAGPAVALAMPQHHSDSTQPAPAVSTQQQNVPVTTPTLNVTGQVPQTHSDPMDHPHVVSSTPNAAVQHDSCPGCPSHDGTEASHHSAGVQHDTGETQHEAHDN